MRKPRDFDAELKALNDKARLLKERKLQRLGELVIACGADALPIEQLAGVLLLADTKDAATREAQRARGAAFFQRSPRRPAPSAGRAPGREPASESGAGPAASDDCTS